MPTYPPILKLSQIDATKPSAGSSIAEYDDALRQIKSFLKAYLAVAHQDNGEPNAASIGAGDLDDNAVLESNLADDSVGRLAIILNGLFTADADGRAKFAAGFVDDTLLGNLAVTVNKFADGALTADATGRAKMEDEFVTAAKMALATITSDRVAPGGIEDSNLATGIDGAKLSEKSASPNAVALAQHKIIVGDATGKGVEAEVGGALTATYDGAGTLEFAIAGASATQSTYALYVEGASKGNSSASSVGSWTGATDHGSPWVLSIGGGSSSFSATAGDAIKFVANGTFLIRASAPGRAVGKHKIRLRDSGSATILHGAMAEAGVGTTTRAELVGVLVVAGASVGSPVSYYLQHWTEFAVTDGFGVDINTGGGDDTYFAMFEIIQIA